MTRIDIREHLAVVLRLAGPSHIASSQAATAACHIRLKKSCYCAAEQGTTRCHEAQWACGSHYTGIGKNY